MGYCGGMKEKVFVGLSGGVDSAVSAALLKSDGYDVIGAFIKIWQPEFIECTWREDRLDAMRVCAALDIPFREIDLSENYRTDVIEDMISSYRSGMTPNPDVLCNTSIKFGSFMEWARENGAAYVATGHYARTDRGSLLRGKDPNKDQSYFLHRLRSSELEHTLFPIGAYLKSEVRALAKRLGLPVADKADSQGLCFAGAITLAEFLSRYIQLQEGPVFDMSGKVVGSHEGAALYTRGQRHGFSISSASAKGAPHYVVSTDVSANTVTVSSDISDTFVTSVTIDDMHWIQGVPSLSRDFSMQARYREKPVGAAVTEVGGKYLVTFPSPHVASPGQSLVIYDNEICLGGGNISAAKI